MRAVAYIIERIDLDDNETRLERARKHQIVGFADDFETANLWVQQKKDSEIPYRGWDGSLYPQYIISRTTRVQLVH